MNYYKKYIKYKEKYINLKHNMIGGSDFNEKKLNDFYFNVKTYYIA